VSECPTKALARASRALVVEETQYPAPEVDCFKCDWARRYGLASKEGISTWGVESDRTIPAQRSGGEIAKAYASVKWGIQKRHINTIEECVRVCPAGTHNRRHAQEET